MKERAELHLHSDNSILDGLGKIPQYAQTAKERGVNYLAITDHGSLSGTYEHYKACLSAGIEPVLGCEFYFVPDSDYVREFKVQQRYHLTVLARGEQGYRILKEMNDQAQANYYYKPLLDKAMLTALGDDLKHLWVFSGCMGSLISQMALQGRTAVTDELMWWKNTCPNFAVEIMSHGIDTEKKLNSRLVQMAMQAKLPIVSTNDCHYVDEEDAENHDALLAIQTASDLDDPNRFRFNGEGYFLRTRPQLYRALSSVVPKNVAKASLDAGISIARDCHTRIPAWDTRSWHIPKYPGVDDPYRRVKSLAFKSLRDRGLDADERYVVRARQELRKIKATGISDFLLICRDQVRWAERHGIRVGTGRGSVAGCLIAFLIGIHKVDSVKYGLKFERFLNPERPKMPDIDTDFPPSRRDEIFKYLADKYGRENVMRVAAFQTMKVAGSFKKLAKAHGIDFQTANEIGKNLNFDVEEDEDDSDISVLPAVVREEYPGLHEQMSALVGTKSALSSHAAGMLVFSPDDPVKDLIPQMWLTGPKHLAGAFDLKSTEKIGLMKMDELGLRTLDTIELCLKFLSMKGIEVEPDEWVPDEEDADRDVYKMLRSGNTAGVFQMEGGTNARGIVEIKCSRFEDVVACTSLYRAGPLGVGADKRYIANKTNKTVLVIHELLRPILSNSWGEMIYQEQMMDICHDIAGFTWIETDDVKETVRFKDPERMKTFKDHFVQGCKDTSGLDEDTALQIWAMIESQSTYLFNRSHAVAYSLITYQTARLKYLYPVEYMAAYLATVPPTSDSAKERRRKIMAEAYQMGFQILPPDINHSGETVLPEYNPDGLRFGFSDIKGIGMSTATKICVARAKTKYNKFDDVHEVDAFGKRAFDALAGSGTLASIGGPEVDPENLENFVDWRFVDRMEKWRKRLQSQVKFPKQDNAYCAVVGELVLFEKKKTKAGKQYRTIEIRWSPAESFRANLWSETSETWPHMKLGSIVAIEGRWSKQWANISVGSPENINILQKGK